MSDHCNLPDGAPGAPAPPEANPYAAAIALSKAEAAAAALIASLVEVRAALHVPAP